jgi:hypothetical protein
MDAVLYRNLAQNQKGERYRVFILMAGQTSPCSCSSNLFGTRPETMESRKTNKLQKRLC